jgi:hypothetical protein
MTDGIVLVRADLEHGDPDGFVAQVGFGELATEVPRQAPLGGRSTSARRTMPQRRGVDVEQLTCLRAASLDSP